MSIMTAQSDAKDIGQTANKSGGGGGSGQSSDTGGDTGSGGVGGGGRNTTGGRASASSGASGSGPRYRLRPQALSHPEALCHCGQHARADARCFANLFCRRASHACRGRAAGVCVVVLAMQPDTPLRAWTCVAASALCAVWLSRARLSGLVLSADEIKRLFHLRQTEAAQVLVS
jgi:hypothetical protein